MKKPENTILKELYSRLDNYWKNNAIVNKEDIKGFIKLAYREGVMNK